MFIMLCLSSYLVIIWDIVLADIQNLDLLIHVTLDPFLHGRRHQPSRFKESSQCKSKTCRRKHDNGRSNFTNNLSPSRLRW
mmetsp:Transcript_29681/g.53873  ORF Transcript_29681/g.53873 Transcript_29681/m.53873 type:complete len:81 (-) Transcript_29681:88-330(-)